MDGDAENDRPLPWPLFTIDFEASCLGSGTYPIEVGVCRWRSPETTIEGWSTLIRPVESWSKEGRWSPASQEIHGIREVELAAGLSPTDAILALNQIVGSRAAYCDGGPYDLHWARMLSRASSVAATFKIGDFDMLTASCDQLGYMRLHRWLDRASPRHRARDDAERLMKSLARGLRLDHGTSSDITVP